jgi:hypothetical protein
MHHPEWGSARVGSGCADLMSGDATRRDREFRRAGVRYPGEMMGDPAQRDLEDWDDSETSLSANGTGTDDRKRESTWNYLQHELDLSPRQAVWGCIFWVLVIFAILYLRDRFK